MPNKKSAMKELKKSKKRHIRNISVISGLKTFSKKIDLLIKEKKADEASGQLKVFKSKIDKAASKGAIEKNLASRRISRLSKKIYFLSKA
ncbi:MAG: 30S ribosomal protein S20 [Candidatus Omnitrophota bacterium]